MELRLEAPGARVPRVDPKHAVEDRQAFLQVAILDPKRGSKDLQPFPQVATLDPRAGKEKGGMASARFGQGRWRTREGGFGSSNGTAPPPGWGGGWRERSPGGKRPNRALAAPGPRAP